MQMQVEDDTSPDRKSKQAHIRVVNRGVQQQVSAGISDKKPEPSRKIPISQKNGLSKGQVSTNTSVRFKDVSQHEPDNENNFKFVSNKQFINSGKQDAKLKD